MYIMKSLPTLVLASLIAAPLIAQATTFNAEDNIRNILYIECGSYVNEVWTPVVSGSGVVIENDYVLTNAHVVADVETGIYYDDCRAGYSQTSQSAPELTIVLNPLYGRLDDYFDYALLEPINQAGGIVSFSSYASLANADSMVLNDYVYVLGYPAVGGQTATASSGSIAGFIGTNWIKTDANIEHGSSGGGAFDVNGNLFAIPTSVVADELNSISYLQNINAILEDLFSTQYVTRDYDHMYSGDNQFCIDDYCYNLADDESEHPGIFADVDSSQAAEDPTLNEDQPIEIDQTPEPELVAVEEPEVTAPVIPEPPLAGRYVPSLYDAKLQTRLKGSILLQTEEHGEAWYVNPSDSLRYYMANGAVAYQMMRSFSLGISDSDLATIPSVANTDEMNAAKSVCKTNKTANRLRGYILLQVEQHGEAWYIDPDTCNRIYMKDGDVAYEIMRYLSLGITNTDLTKLPSGEIE